MVSLTAAVVVAAACGSDTSPPVSPTIVEESTVRTDDLSDGTEDLSTVSHPRSEVGDAGRGQAVPTAGLVGFERCDGLLDHLRSDYTETMDFWLPGHLPATDEDEFTMEPHSGPSSDGVGFSGTNLQEAGVEESDIIKTDGERIYVVSFDRLVVIDAVQRRVLGSVAVADGASADLLVHGDSVLLIRQTRHATPGHIPRTVVQRIEIRDGTPRVAETLRVRGRFGGARRVGDIARVVTSHSLITGLPYPKSHQTEDSPGARAANRDVVLAFTLEDWLPEVRHNGVALDAAASCDNIYAPASFSGFGTTTVLTVNMEAALDTAESVTVMAPGDTVYASPDSLYVTSTNWRGTTDIHRFATAGSDNAAYVASGEVPGYLRNEFSLSEHAGDLRVVATTLDPVWETHLRVLRQNGARLEEVGTVSDIGLGERVHSVRFAGDVAYVATARAVDPLHTIDLTDPTGPQILSELRLPGLSSYLHLIGDGMILGVGTGENGFGADVSLFEVGEPAEPRELARWTASDDIGGFGSDHRRFLWWPSERILVIPFFIGASEDRQGSAVVLRVQGEEIVEVGRIEHVPGETPPAKSPCRLITEDDLPVRESGEPTQFEEIVGWLMVLACEPGEKGAPHLPAEDEWMRQPGFDVSCDPEIPLNDEERAIVARVSETNETINYCWTNVYPNLILRSVVIGDDLWTLSYPFGISGESKGHLEVNDLETLERLAALEL